MGQIIDILPAGLLLISGLPQTIKLIKTKSSKDISAITYFLTWIAIAMLAAKSIMIKDFMLTLSNCVSFCTVSLNLFLILKYRWLTKQRH